MMRRAHGRAERRPRQADDVELGLASVLMGIVIVLISIVVPAMNL
jgi:hypothetical protein